MNRMAAALIAVTMVVVPAAASAQSTTPAPATPATPTTSGAPAPAPIPVKGRLKLSLQRVGSGGVLAGSRWVVRGTLTPYVQGQKASVRFYRHDRKIAVKAVAIQPAGGKVGRFTLGFRAKTPGTITVRATHRATPELATVVAPRVSVSVLPLRATPGARGLAVRVLQQRLSRLGYVVGQRGLYDDRTAQGRHGVPQGRRDVAHVHRHVRGVPTARQGSGPFPRAVSGPWPARRGRHRPPGPRADQREDASSASTR